jgi:hypothetical protein
MGHKVKQGTLKVTIYIGQDHEYEIVELNYTAEDTGDGYEVYCERPQVADASDMQADVLDALHQDGLQNINRILWL